ENCNGITVNRCCLYGCGTLGVNAYTCSDLRLTDCEIYDCSIGGVVLYAVYGASFQNCRIHDVPSPMLDIYDSTVFWNGSVLYDNHYDITPSGEVMSVSIRAVK
ncbi:MAG: right-handed parallel beta-helix repeat-containing protein, partial [Oscillospiraceae bacterium]|nr:right-handed parallel beta-helix repeat-containing protein [Oscillospiraceae bacterium]